MQVKGLGLMQYIIHDYIEAHNNLETLDNHNSIYGIDSYDIQ